MRTDHTRAIELASYHRRAHRFRAHGLNTRGQPYQRSPGLTEAQRRAANLAKYHRRAARRGANGLNTRGQADSRADFTAARRLRILVTQPLAAALLK